MINLLDLDLVSHAARPAHLAAVEIAGLLDDQGARQNWGGFRAADGDAIEHTVARLADYVARRGCETGERLWLWARGERLLAQPMAWPDEAFHVRLAFDLFVDTFHAAYRRMKSAQDSAALALELQTRPAPAPLAIEDTIFAPVGRLDALRPESVAAALLEPKTRKRPARPAPETGAADAMSAGVPAPRGARKTAD